LYVGGSLGNNMGSWDGTKWTAFNSADLSEQSVDALESYNGALYANGSFYSASISYIGKWNGTTWSELGSIRFNGSITALKAINNELYVGGVFDSLWNFKARGIAKWNDTSWTTVGYGIEGGPVYAIAEYNQEIYAGGYFTKADGKPAKGIAKWNGITWSAIGSVTHGYIHTFLICNGELYAGGGFDSIGGIAAKNVAKWNGSTWSEVGGGTNALVSSLCIYNGDLYASGSFDTAGNVPANHIAKLSIINNLQTISSHTDIKIYPMPMATSARILFNRELKDAELIIYDIIGRERFRQKINGNSMEIERGNLVSGVYFVQVKEEERQWLEKMVVE
jgi:hypothetical protein